MNNSLVMTPDLNVLNSRLEYLENQFRGCILGVERRFYRTLIENIQRQIERLVEAQICPEPIIDMPGDFMGC